MLVYNDNNSACRLRANRVIKKFTAYLINSKHTVVFSVGEWSLDEHPALDPSHAATGHRLD